MHEATYSETAARLGIKNEPTDEQLKNMCVVADIVFEPIREHFGVPFTINSFLRTEALNKAIGGATHSLHLDGCAIDISPKFKYTNKEVFDWAVKNTKATMVIGEFPDSKGEFRWVHIGYDPKATERKVLIAKKVNGKTVYQPYA